MKRENIPAAIQYSYEAKCATRPVFCVNEMALFFIFVSAGTCVHLRKSIAVLAFACVR